MRPPREREDATILSCWSTLVSNRKNLKGFDSSSTEEWFCFLGSNQAIHNTASDAGRKISEWAVKHNPHWSICFELYPKNQFFHTGGICLLRRHMWEDKEKDYDTGKMAQRLEHLHSVLLVLIRTVHYLISQDSSRPLWSILYCSVFCYVSQKLCNFEENIGASFIIFT